MANTALLQKALIRTSPEPFGRYEVLGRIASGGMAEVLVARTGNVPGVQALVAVKRMLPHLCGNEIFEDLFEREALISVRIQHETAPRVFEVGKIDGVWFMAMELIQAEPLWDVLKTVRLDPTLAVYMAARIAQVLHHVHTLRGTKGEPLDIVHRDISPQNVLLAYEGHLKLIDFGVARTPVMGTATRAHAVRGKLRYMSPEQALGCVVDARSDLFSLGVMLHECLAGRPLFDREGELKTVEAVLHEKAPPLNEASAEVAHIVARALEKNARHRWQSAAEMAEALFATLTRDEILHGAERIGRLMTDTFPARLHRWRALVDGAAKGLDREIELSVHDEAVEVRTLFPELTLPLGAPPPQVEGFLDTSPLFVTEEPAVLRAPLPTQMQRSARRARVGWARPAAVAGSVGVAVAAALALALWRPLPPSPVRQGETTTLEGAGPDNGPRVVQMPARPKPPPPPEPPPPAPEPESVAVAEPEPVIEVPEEVEETPSPPVVNAKAAASKRAPARVVAPPRASPPVAKAPRREVATAASRRPSSGRGAPDDALLRELEPSPYAKNRR